MRKLATMALAIALVAGARTAHASVILVTTESGITNDGLLDWGALGGNGAVVSNPFTTPVTGVAGLTITGSQDAGVDFNRMDQNVSWSGNFAPGEELLWTTAAAGGPMDFVFNNPITGFGAQIQADFFGAFTASISAFDASNTLLGTFSVNGNSTSSSDDSAIFIGILSTGQDISRIRLSVPTATANPEDFAINAPRIQATSTAPEPVTLLLFGLGLAGAARRFRRR